MSIMFLFNRLYFFFEVTAAAISLYSAPLLILNVPVWILEAYPFLTIYLFKSSDESTAPALARASLNISDVHPTLIVTENVPSEFAETLTLLLFPPSTGRGVGVSVGRGVGVAVGRGVGVAVGRGVGVAVGRGVDVGTGVGVAVGNGVTVGLGVGVTVGTGVGVAVGSGVAVGFGVGVGSGVGVGVSVGSGVGVIIGSPADSVPPPLSPGVPAVPSAEVFSGFPSSAETLLPVICLFTLS